MLKHESVLSYRCFSVDDNDQIGQVKQFWKIPRDLTEASLSGAGLSLIAAFCMILLFGMELSDYLTVSTTTTVVVDESADGDFLRIDFNISFPALSCEFASVDVSDVLGTNRLNITKTVRKYSIDSNLVPTGSEFQSGAIANAVKHDEEVNEEHAEGAVRLTGRNFDRVSHLYPIVVVNFYAPWCYWSNRLLSLKIPNLNATEGLLTIVFSAGCLEYQKPSWEKAAQIVRERYDPENDGRIILGKVDCTEEVDLCRRDDHGHHNHESYYGDRDTDSLVKTMEELVAPIALESQKVTSDSKSVDVTDGIKRPAPVTGGCRVEGFVRVKKVPGNVVVSARSAAHSFDASQMNMSHVIYRFSFGKMLTPKAASDVKRLIPYLGQSFDKLRGNAYITNPKESRENVTIEHYLQVVKTEVVARSYKIAEDYEYTAHSSLVHSTSIPVAKFHFEPSPLQVLITEDSKSFSHFLTNVCAIIGGVFTDDGGTDKSSNGANGGGGASSPAGAEDGDGNGTSDEVVGAGGDASAGEGAASSPAGGGDGGSTCCSDGDGEGEEERPLLSAMTTTTTFWFFLQLSCTPLMK
nr:protein disulfide isomerase-like 5-4 [Ipomoea trifida]